MLLHLKAGGAVVALLAATAGVVALTGTVAAATGQVDPVAALHYSNSPSPSLSVSPPAPLASFAAPFVPNQDSARKLLTAPAGYSTQVTDANKQLPQDLEAHLVKNKDFAVSACTVWTGSTDLLVACVGVLFPGESPQVLEHALLDDDQDGPARFVGNGVVVAVPYDAGAGYTSFLAAASRNSTVVITQIVSDERASVPDAEFAKLTTELLDGAHA